VVAVPVHLLSLALPRRALLAVVALRLTLLSVSDIRRAGCAEGFEAPEPIFGWFLFFNSVPNMYGEMLLVPGSVL
jgi:hypothetical protein